MTILPLSSIQTLLTPLHNAKSFLVQVSKWLDAAPSLASLPLLGPLTSAALAAPGLASLVTSPLPRLLPDCKCSLSRHLCALFCQPSVFTNHLSEFHTNSSIWNYSLSLSNRPQPQPCSIFFSIALIVFQSFLICWLLAVYLPHYP